MKKNIFMLLTAFAVLAAAFTVFGAQAEYEGYIIKLKGSSDGISLYGTDESLRLFSDENIDVIRESEKIFTVKSLDDIPSYISKDDIEYIEPNYKVTLHGNIPNDPYYTYQKNLQIIDAPAFWESGCYGQNIKIAVIDSGVNPVSDLIPNILEGYNYMDENTDTSDDADHGTLVSRIIASQTDNALDIAGVAYRAKIVPLKCLNKDGGLISDIEKALYAAVDTYGCQVINMSCGVDSDDIQDQGLKSFENAVNYAIEKGAIVVASSGNTTKEHPAQNRKAYPACFGNVISVGSVDNTDSHSVSSFSYCNEFVDVVAPGEGVFNTMSDDSSYLIKKSGTSFSAPLVSAMAALCLNIKPDMTYSEFDELLKRSCIDLGDEGRDNKYGYGLLNAKNMLDDLLSGTDYFVSPYDSEADNPSAVVYNNTDTELNNTYGIWSDGSQYKLNSVTVGPRQGEHVEFKSTSSEITLFWWDSHLRPIRKTTFDLNTASVQSQ